MLCPPRMIPPGFEERLSNGITVAECLAIARAPHATRTMHHGHPTEALIIAADRYITPDHPISKLNFYAILVRPLHEAVGIVGPTLETPAERPPAAGELYTALWTRISALVWFAKVIDGLLPPPPQPPARRQREPRMTARGSAAAKKRAQAAAAAARQAAAAGPPPPANLLNHIWMHVDAHMHLLVALDATEEYTTLGAYSDAHIEEMLVRAPISIDLAYTEMDVPDTTVLMSLTPSYNRKVTSNKKMVEMKVPDFDAFNVDIVRRIVSIEYKALHNRCNNREFFEMIRAHCAESPYVAEFFMHLIVASLLGVYSTSRVKLRVHQRIAIYKCFMMKVRLPELMDIMHAGNKNALLYITKEYFQFSADQMPGFVQALREVYEWGMYYRYNMLFCDEMRRVVQRNMLAGAGTLDALFVGVDVTCRGWHEKSRRTQRENGLRNDAATIMTALDGYNYDSYEPDDHPMPPPVPDNLIMWERRGRVVLPENPHPRVQPHIEQLMRDVIWRFPRDKPIPLVWLIFFGVQPSTVIAMTHTVYGKKPDMIRLVQSLPRRTYALFYTFFKLVREYKEYREWRGDAFMMLCHMRALSGGVYNLAPGDPIPKVAGKIQYCPNCGDTKFPSFYPPDCRNKNAKGLGGCMYSLSGKHWCARAPAPPDWRVKESEKPEEDRLPTSYRRRREASHTEKSLKRKKAKGIGIAAMYDRCNFTETRTLNCLGRYTRFRRFGYMACYDCLRVVKVENKTFVGRKVLCKTCALAAARAMIRVYKCEFCDRRIDPKACFLLLVYDDVTPAAELEGSRFRHAKLCPTHGGIAFVRETKTIRPLADVAHDVEKWHLARKHARM